MDAKAFPVVCLMGPTASGKTQLAVELVQRFPFEIISVDSAMVYRGMDIGTAKPSAAELAIAPHRLLDILDPAQVYSAAQFTQDAFNAMRDIQSHNKIPLLVGGTMLYFRALQQGLSPLPSANTEIRIQLAKEAEEQGWPALHRRLASYDAVAAKRIHPHDAQRIQRALEVYLLTGKSLTEWQQAHSSDTSTVNFHNLALAPMDRAVLHERIEKRFFQMLDQGFIEEVKTLFERGDLTLDTPAIRSVGYRQVWQYLLGQLTYQEMIDKSIAATRQLAKRQLTWLRSWPDVTWFDSAAPDLFKQVSNYIDKIEDLL